MPKACEHHCLTPCRSGLQKATELEHNPLAFYHTFCRSCRDDSPSSLGPEISFVRCAQCERRGLMHDACMVRYVFELLTNCYISAACCGVALRPLNAPAAFIHRHRAPLGSHSMACRLQTN